MKPTRLLIAAAVLANGLGHPRVVQIIAVGDLLTGIVRVFAARKGLTVVAGAPISPATCAATSDFFRDAMSPSPTLSFWEKLIFKIVIRIIGD